MPGQVPPCLHAAFEHCAARVPLDGRPVECEHDANSSLVRVSLWSHFPRFLSTLPAKSLQQNPLRQRLDRWCVWGFGAPDFFMAHRTLLWGAPVCALGQWPDAVPPPCNHASVYEQGATSIVHQQLCEEVESGLLLRLSGSRVQQLKPYGFLDHVHPMGAVPKMEGSKIAGYRIIQDYSFPRGCSVNDRINYLRMKYDKVDKALEFVAGYPMCWLAKIDIKGFFRHLPMHPNDWALLCSQWDLGEGPELLVDRRMPFGLRHAPEVCCRFSAVVLHALRRVIARRGLSLGVDIQVSNVVDDWLVCARDHDTYLCIWRLL